MRSPALASHHLVLDQQQTTSVQYQPPWLDHPSSSFHYRSQPHTPSSIRTTTRHKQNIQQQPNSPNMRNNEVRWPMETTMNSSPL